MSLSINWTITITLRHVKVSFFVFIKTWQIFFQVWYRGQKVQCGVDTRTRPQIRTEPVSVLPRSGRGRWVWVSELPPDNPPAPWSWWSGRWRSHWWSTEPADTKPSDQHPSTLYQPDPTVSVQNIIITAEYSDPNPARLHQQQDTRQAGFTGVERFNVRILYQKQFYITELLGADTENIWDGC